MNNQPQGIGGVPARLRMAREQRKLNQSELCVKAGLSRKVCFKIESGLIESNHGISLGTIDRLARALGVRSAWLAFGDGGPTSAQPGATPTGPARPGPGTRPPPPPDPGGATDRRARAPLNEVEEILFWRPGKPVPAGMRKMQEEDRRLMARLDRLLPEADPEDDFEPEMSRPHAHRQFTQGESLLFAVLKNFQDPPARHSHLVLPLGHQSAFPPRIKLRNQRRVSAGSGGHGQIQQQ